MAGLRSLHLGSSLAMSCLLAVSVVAIVVAG
jgi:hypothetical protein